MKRGHQHFATQQQARGEGLLTLAWITGLLLAGLVVNGLAVASAAAGLPFFY